MTDESQDDVQKYSFRQKFLKAEDLEVGFVTHSQETQSLSCCSGGNDDPAVSPELCVFFLVCIVGCVGDVN